MLDMKPRRGIERARDRHPKQQERPSRRLKGADLAQILTYAKLTIGPSKISAEGLPAILILAALLLILWFFVLG